jgi:hypothetical protein
VHLELVPLAGASENANNGCQNCSQKKKNRCPPNADHWLRSANAPLMMPNERRT